MKHNEIEGKPPSVKSTFALLDVMKGRKALARRVDKGERFSVVIRGEITGVWGNDNGISQEFEVDVKSLEVAPK